MGETGTRLANIELKARVSDLRRGEAVCRRLGARLICVETQTDTYFSTGAYRMKLRESSLGDHWLVFYSRPDLSGARKSSYRLVPVPDPAEKKRILSGTMDPKVVVRKERTVWLIGPTRIHLDDVEGLGSFLEFEVVLDGDLSEDDGHRIVERLRAEFDINEEDVVAGSYSDLLLHVRA